MADEFDVEGGTEGDGGDDDMGATPADQATRYDPCVLFYRVSSTDYRNDTTTNADGIQRPAVQQGKMTFLDVQPGVAGLSNFTEGGKAPFPFTAHRMSIRFFFPIYPSDMTARLLVPAAVTMAPRGVLLGQFMARGLFSLIADDSIPIVTKIPVDAIGAAGGIVIIGGSDVATAQNMGTSRRDGFPLPNPIKMTTGGPKLSAFIEWSPADVVYLGNGIAGVGVGSPFPDEFYPVPAAPPVVTPTTIPPAHLMTSLEFWGERGINIHAGASRKAGATAARRQATG